MIYENFRRNAILLIAVALWGTFVACDNEDEKKHNWQVNLPTTIVANGDYLTTSVYGSSDYDFNVNYYWDGALVQTTDKHTGLNYLVSNQKASGLIQSDGEHILKMEFTGDAKGSSEYIIQVYDKNFGFLGCEVIPNNRKVKNGENLQGNVIFIPSTTSNGLKGTLTAARVYIDDNSDKGKAVQTITNAPFNFNVSISGLSKGNHKLIVETEGMGYGNTDAGGGWFLSGGLCLYNFTVTE